MPLLVRYLFFFGFFKTVSCGKMHALESFSLYLSSVTNTEATIATGVLSKDPQKCFLFLLQNTRHKAILLVDRMPPTSMRAILTFLTAHLRPIFKYPPKKKIPYTTRIYKYKVVSFLSTTVPDRRNGHILTSSFPPLIFFGSVCYLVDIVACIVPMAILASASEVRDSYPMLHHSIRSVANINFYSCFRIANVSLLIKRHLPTLCHVCVSLLL